MTPTTVRKTCDDCQQIVQLPATSVVLCLPSPFAAESEKPSFLHCCPTCGACTSCTVSWRTAAFLLDGGATVLSSPDLEAVQPSYPERRPGGLGPMSLDDLIDLHAALAAAADPR